MIEVVNEYVVKEEARGQFELAYGPGGAWSKLFARCPGYQGTTLLRDTENPRRYMSFDFSDTLEQREQALAERQSEYADLDAVLAGWTDSKTELGIFRTLAEAKVQPRGRARRKSRRPGQSLQSGRAVSDQLSAWTTRPEQLKPGEPRNPQQPPPLSTCLPLYLSPSLSPCPPPPF